MSKKTKGQLAQDFGMPKPVADMLDDFVSAETNPVTGENIISAAGIRYNPTPMARNTVVFYGDSHQQKGHGNEQDAKVKYEYFYADCFPWWVQALSKCRFNILGWRAMGGRTTTEIRAWIDQVIELNPGVVVLNGGTNNALVANQNDYTIPLSDMEYIWASLTSRGITVITLTTIITDPTVFSAVGNTADSKIAMIKAFNHYLRERAQNYPGVVLIDAYQIGVNPLSATGAQKTNYLRTDKVHTSNLYAYKIAKAVVAAIDKVIPPIDRLVSSVSDNAGVSGQSINPNLMSNSLFTTTTGGTASTGASGTVPAGWTVSRVSGAAGTAVAVSTAARSDGLGNDMVLTITGDAAETNGLISADYVINLATPVAIVEGASYYAKCELTLGASPVAAQNIYMRLASDSTSPPSTYFAECGHADTITGGTIYPMEEGFTAVFETPACIAQPGVSGNNFTLKIRAYVGPSASVVVKIGRISLHRANGYPLPMDVIVGST